MGWKPILFFLFSPTQSTTPSLSLSLSPLELSPQVRPQTPLTHRQSSLTSEDGHMSQSSPQIQPNLSWSPKIVPSNSSKSFLISQNWLRAINPLDLLFPFFPKSNGGAKVCLGGGSYVTVCLSQSSPQIHSITSFRFFQKSALGYVSAVAGCTWDGSDEIKKGRDARKTKEKKPESVIKKQRKKDKKIPEAIWALVCSPPMQIQRSCWKKKEWSIGTQSDRTSMTRMDETTYEYGIIFSFIIGKYIDKTDSNTDDVLKFW